MLKSYLKTAWRNLQKHKAFSLINILGLALGFACSLLIMLWVFDEKGIDGFHTNNDRLYSVFERQYHDGVIDGGHYTPGLLADEMKLTVPEVQYATGFAWNGTNTFEANHKILKAEGNHAGEDFFKMFSYPLLQGDATTALKTSIDIAISRKMAEDFFGSPEAAYGGSIRFENRKDLKVSAVFDVPESSSLKFDYLINWQTFLENNSWAKDWSNNGPNTFLTLREGTDALAFENKIRDFMDLHREGQNENFIIKLGLQPFSEMYLYSSMKDGEIVGGRIQYVNLFTIVAVFILLIACINFMNLTTARSMKRAREIGVRKVAGAVRGALIRQFLGEAFFTITIGLMIGIVIVALVLPAFNIITQKQMAIPFDQVAFWIGVLGVTFITGMISGTYPAIYLSSFTPVRAFKGTLKFGSKALWFRKGLVVLQFTLSVILIIGTIVISRQIEYIQTANLGYDRENLIYIPLEGDLPAKYELFKNRSLDVPGIQAVSRITQSPTSIENGTGGVWWEGKDPNAVLQFVQVGVGYDFIRTMNIELKDGRDFSRDFAWDSAGYIVNEAAVKIFGYQDPVGMPLTFWQRPGKIIGVTKDFHFNSLHNDIKPLIIRLGENQNGWVLVRMQAERTNDALSSLQAVCTELNPKFPFTYKFSDEEYHKMYASEQVVSKLSDVFAVLAIFISCLGLLGLAMFTVEQRTKEIGIRKVLGASIFSLFNLLSKDLMLLVVIALFIAAPLAWLAMDNWLSEYAYRVDLAWWIFASAGVVAMLIALMTISFQTLKALLSNPVASLRSD